MSHCKTLKILFIALLALMIPLGSVGAQDVTTVSMWFNEGSSLDCRGPIMEEFNDIDSSIQLQIVPQANAWDVTRTAVAGGGGPDVVRDTRSLFRLRNGASRPDSAHGRLR